MRTVKKKATNIQLKYTPSAGWLDINFGITNYSWAIARNRKREKEYEYFKTFLIREKFGLFTYTDTEDKAERYGKNMSARCNIKISVNELFMTIQTLKNDKRNTICRIG